MLQSTNRLILTPRAMAPVARGVAPPELLLLLLLLLLAAAFLASSCPASPPHAASGAASDETPEEKAAAATMGQIADPKCSEMVRCTPAQCMDYCNLIGLVRTKGFCTFHGLQFYCCCSVPFPRAAAAKTPTISS